jgi:hypothetical protein
MAGDSDDHFFNDLVNQVEIALEAIDIEGVDACDSIVEGLRQALQAAAEIEMEAGSLPEVVVLEGGRSGAAPDDGERDGRSSRPELRVIERDEEAPKGVRDIRVKVIGPQMIRRRNAERAATLEGTILVDNTIEWQTIYRGDEPATYRVWRADGSLELALDGQWVEAMNPGQSLDVRASLIRVRTGEPDPVAASYVRV